MKNNKRIWNTFVAISILLSSIMFGSYKKTLSASLGEIQENNKAAFYVCKVLDVVLIDPDHCKKEYNDWLKEQE